MTFEQSDSLLKIISRNGKAKSVLPETVSYTEL